MSSFQQPVPKYFCLNKLKVLKDISLFLDRISRRGDWDEADTGLRAMLKVNLQDFAEAHQEMVEQRLEFDSAPYTLAILSTKESVA